MATLADPTWGFSDLDVLSADRAPAPLSRPRRHRERAGSGEHRFANELALRGFALHRRLAGPDLPVLDHLVVAGSGVWIVGREQVHCAKVSVRGRFAAKPSLRIGDRDRTALVDDLDRQLTAVRGLLFDALDVPVQAALCLPGAEFPLLRTLAIGDHQILRPAQLLDQLDRRGAVKRTRAREVAGLLDARLG
ncbi:MAG: hypothetical protein Q7T55_07925 [Solirubrobacteraceae bacterium]|nr:hypothetical protein [Solirubrobacteraceae bacterium]